MSSEISFTRGTFYKAGGGMSHLKHALRDRYDKKRIAIPDIRISKFDGTMTDASKEELYKLYDYNLQARQRKNANVYFDYVVSDYDPEKTVDIAKHLRQVFDNRPVFVLQHLDEGHYHTHFIIFSKDSEHAKSPNLKRNDLHMLRINIGKITQQKVKERGTGLQKHVGPSSDVKREKALVEEQKQNAKRMMQIQNQIKPILDVYGSIEIFSLLRDQGKLFKIWNGTGRTVFDDVDQLPMKKLLQLDDKPGEHLLFRPAFDEHNRVRGLFLDDVPEEKINELPNGTVIVETSPGKYQAHIPLPEPYSKENANGLQRALAAYFESDPGAKDIMHMRRLPGFKNKKYVDMPTTKIAKIIQNDITMDYLQGEIQDNILTNTGILIEKHDYFKRKNPVIAQEIEMILKTDGQETWDKFLTEANGDESVADIKFALRELRKGYHPEAVAYSLLVVSRDIQVRKPEHVEDYVNRTVEKAKAYIRATQQQEQQLQRQKNIQ